MQISDCCRASVYLPECLRTNLIAHFHVTFGIGSSGLGFLPGISAEQIWNNLLGTSQHLGITELVFFCKFSHREY
jgi:hypothetical protein